MRKETVEDTVVMQITVTDTVPEFTGDVETIEQLYKAILGVDDVKVNKLQVFHLDTRKENHNG